MNVGPAHASVGEEVGPAQMWKEGKAKLKRMSSRDRQVIMSIKMVAYVQKGVIRANSAFMSIPPESLSIQIC